MPIINENVDQGTIDLKKTWFSRTIEKAVRENYTIATEGRALISEVVSGDQVVRMSAGASTDAWLGISMSDTWTMATWPDFQDLAIPAAAPYMLQLNRTNLFGSAGTPSVYVYDVTAAAAGTEVTTLTGTTGQFLVDYALGQITWNVADTGHSVEIQYRYNLTVAEVEQRFQQAHVNSGAGAAFNQIGVGIGPGELFTSEFDSSQAYTTGVLVYAGALGVITSNNAGSVVTIGRVIKSPDSESSMLGISVRAPL